MKGKKSDPQFVSQFISNCVKSGFITTEAMVAVAKHDIQDIDLKIKEMESLKITRCKLLDVISTFEKPEIKIEQAKILPFFNIKHPQICKRICDELKDKNAHIDIDHIHDSSDYMFCIKQMLDLKIISRYGQFIVWGERFGEYMKFVLHE
jgi:hypothetical protein